MTHNTSFCFRKQVVLLVALLLIPSAVKAFVVKSGDVWYDINGTATVVADPSGTKYSGDIVIPPLVLVNIGGTVYPYSVFFIGDKAFEECTGMKSVVISNGVMSIGEYAFRGCSGLTSVTIPATVTSIGYGAFASCKGLTSVTIPVTVTSIGDYAFGNCELKTVTINSSAPFAEGKYASDYFGRGVQEYIIGASITRLPRAYFWADDELVSVTLPNSVTSIGDNAFCGCKKLKSLTIPNGVTSIEYGAFERCSSLTSMTIPNGVTDINHRTFYGCTSLASVTLPNSLTYIDSDSFSYSGLTSVTIPGSVTTIGSYAFWNCDALTSVTIQEGVTSIHSSAFSSCDALKSIEIPNSVTSIGDWAFGGCSSLSSLTIGNSVKTIDPGAFSNCSNLKKIYCHAVNTPEIYGSTFLFYDNNDNEVDLSTVQLVVPEVTAAQYRAHPLWGKFSITTTQENVFKYGALYYEIDPQRKTAKVLPSQDGTKYAGDISIDPALIIGGNSYVVTEIGESAFEDCTGLTSIILPQTPMQLQIRDKAFYGCTNLTSVYIPEGTVSIGIQAFYGCSNMRSAFIPSGLLSVGKHIFSNCPRLGRVILASDTPPGSIAGFNVDYQFSGIQSSAVLYVPNRTAYLKQPWTTWFSSIKSFSPSDEKTVRYDIIGINGGTRNAWGLRSTYDESKIMNLKIDGENVKPFLRGGYLIVSDDVTKIPLEVSYLWNDEDGVTPIVRHYHVVNYGIYIEGQEMTSLNMYNVPGYCSRGKAYFTDEASGDGWANKPTLVLDDAVMFLDGRTGVENNRPNDLFNIQVNGYCVIYGYDENFNPLYLGLDTRTKIKGDGTLYLYSDDYRHAAEAIYSGYNASLSLEGKVTVKAITYNGYAYYDEGQGRLQIGNEAVFCAYSRDSYPMTVPSQFLLGNGIGLRYPVDGYWNDYVLNSAGNRVEGDWVIFGPDNQVTRDLVTGVDNVNADDNLNQNKGVYNLSGQKVGEGYRGIVIKNGKKVLIK